MKLMFLIRSLEYAGSERQLVSLAEGLHKLGHDVSVAIFYSGGPLIQHLHRADVPVHELNKKRRWDVLAFVYRLARLLMRERPDVLYSFLPMPNVLAILLSPLARATRIVWGVRGSNRPMARYDPIIRFARWLERLLSRYPDLIISNSETGRNHALQNGFPEEKVIVIPNGIDTARFHPDRFLGIPLRNKWGIKSDEKLIGIIGRLDPMKDHPTFLRAASQIVKKSARVRFVCIGTGNEQYTKEIHRLADSLGLQHALVFQTPLEDMAAAYNALDVFTLSSAFGEGFPNTLGEAMACCVPCVVTDVGDAAFILGGSEEVVSPEDFHKLAQAWARCLGAQDGHRTRPARQRIMKKFGLNQMIQLSQAALLTTTSHA